MLSCTIYLCIFQFYQIKYFDPRKLNTILFCMIVSLVSSMAEDDNKFVKDGTVDYKNNPAIKNQTGTWRACPYILGTVFSPFQFM